MLNKLRMKLFFSETERAMTSSKHLLILRLQRQNHHVKQNIFARNKSTVIYAKNFRFDETTWSLSGNRNHVAWDMICIAWK